MLFILRFLKFSFSDTFSIRSLLLSEAGLYALKCVESYLPSKVTTAKIFLKNCHMSSLARNYHWLKTSLVIVETKIRKAICLFYIIFVAHLDGGEKIRSLCTRRKFKPRR